VSSGASRWPPQIVIRYVAMSDFDTNVARLEAALSSADPTGVAFGLAIELRDAGMPQADLLAVFDASRARHHDDADERRYDALLDVMDFISGWVSPSRALYPPPSGAT
jgi:hypothetical protein